MHNEPRASPRSIKVSTNIKLALQSFAINFFLMAIFTAATGPGAYIVGFMVGRFYGLRSGLDGSSYIIFSAFLASLVIWIPFVLATSGLGIILLPAFAAYALFVWIGLCSGDRARRKEKATSQEVGTAETSCKE
jgi:hypothetical protein